MEKIKKQMRHNLIKIATFFEQSLGYPRYIFAENISELGSMEKQMMFCLNFTKEYPKYSKENGILINYKDYEDTQ